MGTAMLWLDIDTKSVEKKLRCYKHYDLQVQFNIIAAGDCMIEVYTYKRHTWYETQISIWSIEQRKLKSLLLLNGYTFEPKLSPDEKFLFVICSSLPQADITYWAVVLENHQMGPVYRTSGFIDCIIHPTDDELIIGSINEIIVVNWKEAVGYQFYDHMRNVIASQRFPDTIGFCKASSELAVYPSMVRLTHVYTFVQALTALKAA